MKNQLLLLFLLTFSSSLFSQTLNDIKKDSLVISDYKEILKKEVDSLMSANDYKSIEEIPEKNRIEPIPNALKNVFDRLYVENIGIETYRENLDEILGRIVFKDNGATSIGLLSIKVDSAQIKSFVPDNGKLLSHKLTKNSSASISLFVNASASEERIYEYYVTDISRAILKSSNIDKELLKKLTANVDDDKLKEYYVITGATVTEIYKKDFEKKSRKIKADNFPVSGVAISFEGNFFVSDENFEREYKIGLTASRLDIIKMEVDNLLE